MRANLSTFRNKGKQLPKEKNSSVLIGWVGHSFSWVTGLKLLF